MTLPYELIRVENKCPTCGKDLFAMYRRPFSPVRCENGHMWEDKHRIEKELKPDGRWHVIRIMHYWEEYKASEVEIAIFGPED